MKKIGTVLLAILLIGAWAIGETPPTVPAKKGFDPGGTGDFHFVVMGDNRPWREAPETVKQNEYFLGNIQRANALPSDFAVIVGDLIHGRTDDYALVARQWDAFDVMCHNFKMPYVMVVGNHDVWDGSSGEIWRRRYGPEYFSWDHKGCHFIALDSEVVGEIDQIAGKQLRWLREDLKRAASARRIFVFVHRPLWDAPPDPGEPQNPWNRDVHPLLAAAGVDTVFAGHRHHYCLHPTRDGVRYVVTGGAGAELDPYELAGGFFHFLDVTVKDKKADFEVVTADGRLPADCITVEKVQALQSALVVDPIPSLPQDNWLTIRAHLKNPTNREAQLKVTVGAAKTFWQIGKVTEPLVPPSGEAVLEVQAKVDRMFPLPTSEVELRAGGKKLFVWDNILSQALDGIGPLVTEWNVVAPFDLGLVDHTDEERGDRDRYLKGAMPGWENDLEPEKKVDLSATYPGKGGKKIRWQPIRADARGFVDLDAVYHEDCAVACAAAYIDCPKNGEYYFSVGSDDSIIIRINGMEVWRNRALRSARVDEDFFGANLRAGWNEVVLKVVDRYGGWGFYFRVLDPGRTLKFALRPPPQPAAAPKK